MKRKIIFFLICLSFATNLATAQRKSDQLKNDKKKIENEINSTQKLLEETKKNKNTSLQQLAVLRKQITNRESLITTMNTEIFSLEETLDLNQKLLLNLNKKLEYMKDDYARVVYLAYKNRNFLDKITFIFSAESFSQMFRRARYYNLFSANIKQQVELIEQTCEEINKKNEQILQLKDEKTVLLNEKEREIKALERDRNKKSRMTEELKKKERQLAADLKTKQAKRKELDVAIKKAVEEEIRAENAKKKKSSTTATTSSGKSSSSSEILLTPEEKIVGNSFAANKGKLPWPVAKGTKIADFGNYPHPDVPSVMIENRGIDILVEPNTQVRAVFEGVVTGVLDILGTKVVMVRHGEYLTVYQNLNSVSVKKGDKVTIKQTIGKVAKSTTSTTYELHFEVWKNDTYINPSTWLSGR